MTTVAIFSAAPLRLCEKSFAGTTHGHWAERMISRRGAEAPQRKSNANSRNTLSEEPVNQIQYSPVANHQRMGCDVDAY